MRESSLSRADEANWPSRSLGLRPSAHRRRGIRRRIARRMESMGIREFRQYRDRVRNDPSQREALRSLLTVTISRFFRTRRCSGHCPGRFSPDWPQEGGPSSGPRDAPPGKNRTRSASLGRNRRGRSRASGGSPPTSPRIPWSGPHPGVIRKAVSGRSPKRSGADISSRRANCSGSAHGT
jgi:hypothetical protein